MVLYGSILSVMVEKIKYEYLGLIQSCYADDFSTAGAGTHLKPIIYYIDALGLAHGLFTKPEKS